MTTPNIKTAVPVVPMIYAYTTPGVVYHDGWTKIGYTERNVEARIREQIHTANIRWNLEWKGNAMFDDGSGMTFRDTDFHAYLRNSGVEQERGTKNEWFKISGPDSQSKFFKFRSSCGVLDSCTAVVPYELRDEQAKAVEEAMAWFAANKGDAQFLWNCKPRFGKTLAVYDLAKKLEAKTVLIVTNRPSIANSWLQDYNRFLGPESGYRFVSETDSLAGKRGVLTRQQFLSNNNSEMKCLEFVSLQDLKGSLYFGGRYDKLQEIANLTWDLLVVDEAHEGVDTYKTDVAFDRIKRKATLHLSGTPFKALARGKFESKAIFNWTYADEQRRKTEWSYAEGEENPYATLPRMSLYTYRMSEIVKDKLKRGIDIDGEREDYAFDLNEFFSTDGTGRFRHDAEVDKFLDALTTQEKFPFSTEALRDELRHTFWMLERVDSAKALARKLGEHPVFKDYAVVLAAGDGRIDDEDRETAQAYDKVVNAIDKHERTITISVGQLSTGVTVPQWTAVVMLCNMKSAAQYMQAAFRAQNPCLFMDGGVFRRKTDAYVFDFDPARTLTIFEQFANDLCSETSAGKGDAASRARHVGELLNFFPVIAEDDNGTLAELDAERVLSIPRRIKSVEVVRHGFMSNFLFQNIAQVFAAPHEVMRIIEKFQAVGKEEALSNGVIHAAENLSLNGDGEVELSEDAIEASANKLFGEKIYATNEIISAALQPSAGDARAGSVERLKEAVKTAVVKEVVEEARKTYGDNMKPSDARKLESVLSSKAERAIDTVIKKSGIDRSVVEKERKDALLSRFESGRTAEEINREFDERQKALSEAQSEAIKNAISDFTAEAERETVRTVETRAKERERDTLMDEVRDHLRGFARTIPSFLMAYGDEHTTLATFDAIIPDNVFREVASISLAEFRFLRDGGEYTDEATGETRHFAGNLFDPVVFDDSIKEFLDKRRKLADYFDETLDEDIFDYIPPQKNNQIFTPKKVVKKMVDFLERENPGCFDNPEKTFIDMYMKSGSYIVEIVKRLYRSEEMKRVYPDARDRLRHIFSKQVFGFAPTEIIYRIATSYILGFAGKDTGLTHNFKLLDALSLAKEGRLAKEVSSMKLE